MHEIRKGKKITDELGTISLIAKILAEEKAEEGDNELADALKAVSLVVRCLTNELLELIDKRPSERPKSGNVQVDEAH